jgi:hypothetical protein
MLKDIYNEKKGVIHNSIIQIDAIKKGLKFISFDELNIMKRKFYSRFFEDGGVEFLLDERERFSIQKPTSVETLKYSENSKLLPTPKLF